MKDFPKEQVAVLRFCQIYIVVSKSTSVKYWQWMKGLVALSLWAM